MLLWNEHDYWLGSKFCRRLKAHAHRRRRVCAAQIATRPVCIEQYISTGSKPERCVS